MTRDRMIRLSYILLPRLATFESLDRLRNTFAMLRDCGYAGVELNLTEPLGIDRPALHRLLTEAGLVVPSFLTGEAYQDGLCLSSPDASVRARTIQRLTGYLDVAREFGALLVVGLLQGLRRDEPDPGVANQRIIDGLKVVAESASAKGVDRRHRAGESPPGRFQQFRRGGTCTDRRDRRPFRSAHGRHDPSEYRRELAHQADHRLRPGAAARAPLREQRRTSSGQDTSTSRS